MSTIIKAGFKDAEVLSQLAELTLIQSHGTSAPASELNIYIKEKYSINVFQKELADKNNNYYFISHHDRPVGYSNIIFNSPFTNGQHKNISKLDRIYLLEEYYDLKLGSELFQSNVHLAKQNHQTGIWLYVWKDNARAVRFYEKKGFKIIGSGDFKISNSHSNPNYLMLLEFKD